jgi:hypothetical protein
MLVRAGKPSATARFVALTRAKLDRPELPTGDADAELRLYHSLGRSPLGEGSTQWRERMARRTAFFDRASLAALEPERAFGPSIRYQTRRERSRRLDEPPPAIRAS